MGYFIKGLDNIASVTEPARFSLSDNPNFVQFEASDKKPEKIVFKLTLVGFGDPRTCYFSITETKTQITHYFYGMSQGDIPDGENNFFTLTDYSLEINAANLAYCFKKNSYLSANFDIFYYLDESGDRYIVQLESKTADRNEDYLFTYTNIGDSGHFIASDQPFFPDANADTFVDITFKMAANIGNIQSCKLKFTETLSGVEHEFIGTRKKSETGNDTFLIEMDRGATANNIRDCLRKNTFFGSMFDCGLPFVSDFSDGSSTPQFVPNPSICIRSKGKGTRYSFRYEVAPLLVYEKGSSYSYNSDSFGYNNECEIHLDIYKHNGVFPGRGNCPDEAGFGEYITTLTKSYSGSPLWFNINTVVSPGFSTDALFGEGWHNTGTLSDTRFIAHRLIDGGKDVFYLSDVFYMLKGYRRTLENNDLSEYVYDTSGFMHVKPLTTQPLLFHIEGQTQFFNFILSDPDHANTLSGNLGITYKLYSQSGRSLGTKVMHTMPMHQFYPVNTIRLSMDEVMREYPNAGQIEVYLSRQSAPNEEYRLVSYPLTFKVLPAFLYKVNDFAFLNSMSGWSSFNFAGTDQSEFKAKANTFFQTHTPDKVVSSRLETVYSKDVEEQFTVQTMPVTREVAEWLRELSASKAVYELSTGRYVIVDELNIKPNSKDDLFRLDMKYRYSDTYNAR